MDKLNWTVTLLIDGEDIESDITADEASIIKRGLDTGNPFSFSTDGIWNWVNPDKISMACVGEK